MQKDLFMLTGKLALFMVGIVFLILVPTSFFESMHSICIFKNIMGIECPGCGMTRAVSSIFHGNFIDAFQYNKFVVIVFPLLCYICIKTIVKSYRCMASEDR
jgi:hypothetical protein